MARPVPRTDFTLAGELFEIEQAGPIEEVLLTFYIGETKGLLSWYYGWFPPGKEHAVDWALLHNKKLNRNIIGHFTPPFTFVSTKAPVRINEFAPKGNRTQIGIAMQKKEFFLVRFIISFNENRDRHTFMLEYKGEAPERLIGKVYWGSLMALGNTPASTMYMEGSHS
jgi:hypothetical protein